MRSKWRDFIAPKLDRIVHGRSATTNIAFGGDDWKRCTSRTGTIWARSKGGKSLAAAGSGQLAPRQHGQTPIASPASAPLGKTASRFF
jgi:hypothetical protein